MAPAKPRGGRQQQAVISAKPLEGLQSDRRFLKFLKEAGFLGGVSPIGPEGRQPFTVPLRQIRDAINQLPLKIQRCVWGWGDEFLGQGGWINVCVWEHFRSLGKQ